MIRIGIVGCGRILAAHLQGYRLLREAGVDQFRIAALCSRKESDARMYVRRGEGPPQRAPVGMGPGDPLAIGDQYVSDFQEEAPQVYTDFREMIERGPIDAVNDFSTHALHHEVAAAAFSHGRHLMTQKPLAVTVAAGRQMCRHADSQGLTFAVFENARFRAETRMLRWAFSEEGPCGPLRMVNYTNLGNWWAPDQIVAETPWRHRRAEGGGLTLDIGVHLFDQIRYVAGEIQQVFGQCSVQEPQRRRRGADGSVIEQIECDADDTFACGFTTERGVQGTLECSWSGHGEATMSGGGRGMCWHGARGSVIGDDLQIDGGPRRSLAATFEAECPAEQRRQWFPYELTDSFALNQLDWLRAIQDRRAPETSGAEGLRDLAASFAVLESDRSGRRVRFQDVLDGAEAQYQKECLGDYVVES